ncbi:hypothetical protein DPMN_192295 [Dreissena polymorpha]|uniref:Peptidase C45 hydrolase domain-containing protein n=1 Tax=Dreissena polymorpha TaxID=45954 RepID=A0A9D3Y4J3_DREPO|nr:hypothetical protein DPMN_192295 [Dreissena polymorpha]
MMSHNEDWIKDLAGKCFVVDVTINKNDVTQDLDASTGKFDDVSTSLTEIQRTIFQRNERFVSYVTPGDLPGFNYAMNKNFVITINSQMPLQMNTGAVPIMVLLRVLLACDTIDEIVAVMKNEPVGSCYGINVNIASIHTDDMWSLEVYTFKIPIIHVEKLTQPSSLLGVFRTAIGNFIIFPQFGKCL